jgi:tripartite-type tricarboxylate transporter receptor subunit TctC
MCSRRFVLVALLALTASLAVDSFAVAADPQFTKAVRIIVPYAPGGSSDILARLIGPHLSKAVGQPVVVENKPGATGNIGADLVAKAEKDGHTLLLADMGAVAAAPSLFTKLTYDPEKDLTGVGMVMFAPYILAVHPSVPVKTVAELVAHAKANPGKLALGHSGVGNANHLTGIVLAKHWDRLEIRPLQGWRRGHSRGRGEREQCHHQWGPGHPALRHPEPAQGRGRLGHQAP